MSLQRTPSGEFVPFAKVCHRRVADMMDGVLPPWLSTTGTAAFVDAVTSYPHLAVATDGTAGAIASLVTDEIDLSKGPCRAVKWTLEGVSIDTIGAINNSGVADTSFQPSMGLWTEGSAGVEFYHEPSATTARIKLHRPTPGTPQLYYQWRPWARSRRNLSMLLLPVENLLYILEDDQVQYYRPLDTNWVAGVVRGRFQVRAETAAVKTMRVAQVKLELWHN